MLLLSDTTSTIQVVTGSAGAISVHASYVDVTVATQVVAADTGINIASIATATTTTVVAAPGAGIARNVGLLSIKNTSGSVANLITVNHVDSGGQTAALFSATLQPNEYAELDTFGRWTVLDTNGAQKTTLSTSPALTQYQWTSGASYSLPNLTSALTTDVVVFCSTATTGARTLNIPNGFQQGRRVTVVDLTFNAQTNNISMVPNNGIANFSGHSLGLNTVAANGGTLTAVDAVGGTWTAFA